MDNMCQKFLSHVSRFSSKAPYSNPYAGEEQGWRGQTENQFHSLGRAGSGDEAIPGRSSWGGWRDNAWGTRDNIPMGLMSARHLSPNGDSNGEWINLMLLCNTYSQSANSFFDCVFQYIILLGFQYAIKRKKIAHFFLEFNRYYCLVTAVCHL